MADESLELEDGALVSLVVNGSSAANVQLRDQLHEAATVLRHRGLPDLERLALCLVDADLHQAIRILDDGLRGDSSGDPVPWGAFFRTILMRLRIRFQETSGGYIEEVFSEALPAIVLEAAQHAAALTTQQPGFGGVPASAAAVRSLEKQTFRAAAGGDEDGITECIICLNEFVDGVQLSVMPCPSGVHKFHTACISKWLAISNVCPFCRHELPSYYE